MALYHERAVVAALARRRDPDDPELAAAREQLAFARVEKRAQQIADALPPLTAEQRTRIRALLLPALQAGGNDAST